MENDGLSAENLLTSMSLIFGVINGVKRSLLLMFTQGSKTKIRLQINLFVKCMHMSRCKSTHLCDPERLLILFNHHATEFKSDLQGEAFVALV